ncbi:MAG: hypothetical protein K8R53_16360 [Bacteroidales bacterium]|nr:hypothetical protein [Bacteroidales bacterium]
MSDELKHIDKIFRENLDGFEAETSRNLWGRLSTRLWLSQFGKLVLIVAGAVIIGVVGYLSFSDSTESEQFTEKESIYQQNSENLQTQISPADTISEGNNQILEKIHSTNQEDTNSDSENNIVYGLNPDDKPVQPFSNRESEKTNPVPGLQMNPVDYKHGEDQNIVVRQNHQFLKINQFFLVPELVISTGEQQTHPAEVDAGKYYVLEGLDMMGYRKFKQRPTVVEPFSPFSLDVFISPFSYNKNILGSDEYSSLVLRKEGEKPTVSFSFGIELSYKKRNWFLQTGLNYIRFRENINYDIRTLLIDSLNSYYTTDTMIGWVYDPPNLGYPVIIGYEDVFVPSYLEKYNYYSSRNSISYLEIPFMTGFRKRLRLIELEASAGFGYNIFINANGILLRNEDEVIPLDKNKDLFENTFNYTLQVGIGYFLNEKICLRLRPYYKNQLGNTFKDGFGTDHRNRSFGLKAGISLVL